MSFDLSRFHEAQSGGVHEQALVELRSGRKRSHWIWFVLPQLQGLGRSGTARLYSLSGRAEAEAYLADPVLRARLEEVVAVVREQVIERGVPLALLLSGSLDATKAVSSLTLFEAVSEPGSRLHEDCRAVLDAVEEEGLQRCGLTVRTV